MEILTCIKQVPGTTSVEVDETTGVLKRDGVDSKMNPYDLYALETALRIKEDKKANLKVLSMGPPQAKKVIEESFMMGADEGALISDRRFGGADVLATSYTISQGIKKMGKVDLIICGKQTTDGDTAQVGPEVAELDMPNDLQVCEIEYPCLITVEKDIFQPRLPSFKLKLNTKDREIPVYSLDDFEDKNENNYGLNGSPTQVVRIFPPKPNTDKNIVRGNADELSFALVNKLEELKLV